MIKLIVISVTLFWSLNSSLSKPTQNTVDDLRRRFNPSECNVSWDHYKSNHLKSYDNQVELSRRTQFEYRKNKILEHNKLFVQGKSDFYTTVNGLSDMNPTERRKLFGLKYSSIELSLKSRLKSSTRTYKANKNIILPKSVDQTTSGWTEPIRDQGQCGSCWAFAVSSAMSFYYYNKTKLNYIFSPQNLVDCSGNYGNEGCNGSIPDYAFEYILEQKISLESDYSYVAKTKRCKRYRMPPLFTATSYIDINQDQDSLKQAVAKLGAIVVGIDAELLTEYGGGIWDGSFDGYVCDKFNLNHAVTLVGYGSSGSKNYWLLKNSWGSWGEDGYFRMKMDGTNVCGILSMASTLV